MIIEGIVTTINQDGTTNVAPMGPAVAPDMSRFELRPFQSSSTYANLKQTGRCVMHVTDDVELLAAAAVDQIANPPETKPTGDGQGRILLDCCRWFSLRVASTLDLSPRATLRCEIVERGRVRDFIGFNRAKHAVLEAAILATRIDLLPTEQIHAEFSKLEILVKKTGDAPEKRAFSLLAEFVQQAFHRDAV